MLTGGQEENWKNDLLILGKILTTWLKLRGLQANQEFFGLLRAEGPGEIVSWVPAVSGREKLQSSQQGLPSITLTMQRCFTTWLPASRFCRAVVGEKIPYLEKNRAGQIAYPAWLLVMQECLP